MHQQFPEALALAKRTDTCSPYTRTKQPVAPFSRWLPLPNLHHRAILWLEPQTSSLQETKCQQAGQGNCHFSETSFQVPCMATRLEWFLTRSELDRPLMPLGTQPQL